MIILSAGSLLLLLLSDHKVSANPASKPYIAFRTSPTDQDMFVDHVLQLSQDQTTSQIHPLIDSNSAEQQQQCRNSLIRFSLGISKRVHGDWTSPIVSPPLVYPVFPAKGPGRQVLLNHYEHVDLLSPGYSSNDLQLFTLTGSPNTKKSRRAAAKVTAPKNTATTKSGSSNSITSNNNVKEVLLQAPEYPLLMEGSMFWTTPLIADVNGDGRPKAIVTDSDGGIYIVGLSNNNNNNDDKKKKRFFSAAQTPRLFVRREWIQRRVEHESGKNVVHENADLDDPYHTYFEYYHHDSHNREGVLQGVSANAWSQDSKERQQLQQRRREHEQERNRKRTNSTVEQKDQQQPGGSRNQEQQKNAETADDFQGTDDLQYMLAKERNAEQRGVYDDVDIDLRQGAIQRRRLQEEEADQDRQQNHQQEQEAQAEQDQAAQDQQQEQQQHQAGEEQQQVQAEQAGEAQEQPAAQEQPQQEGEQQQQIQAEQGQSQQEQPGGQEQQQQQQAQDGAQVPGTVSGQEQQQVANGDAVPQQQEQQQASQITREERGLYDDVGADPSIKGPKEVPDVDRQRAMDDLGNDVARDDPTYGMQYDDYYRRGGGNKVIGDDAYQEHNEKHREYYDSKHYIRIPPHILSTPVLAELPKLYTKADEKEDVLFVAVSYFLDEDQYEGLTGYKRFVDTDIGDETEVKRGMYVASAVMAFNLGESTRWTGQTHLDLSTDFTAPENLTIVGELPIRSDNTKMGAFALGSPTIADIDGDGNLELLLGTSMGMVYAFDARNVYKKSKFPVQMPRPVESRILVEDVLGNTNLEFFVADIGGNVICFSHEATPLWHRNLATSIGLKEDDVEGSSPMTLGDVNGDGVIDLVIALLVQKRSFIFALNAATGEDLQNFPIEFELSHYPKQVVDGVHKKLIQPLLVDLHSDQSFLNDYIRRNGTKWVPPKGKGATPGSASGLHIVYPQDEYLHVIEAGSGCGQVIPIGDPITAMVQADDVHGTNRLDLVVATAAGDVITLESPSPYHPLNTWNQGELRGRVNGNTHGYSASQGIFVHELSRQYIDVFGVYIPITFEIFDNRPNIANEPEKRRYQVEVRDGTSSKRAVFRSEYKEPGVYTERVYVRYGPGFYSLHVVLQTSHGLFYEDTFHIGYNVRFMNGFGILLWLPLLVASTAIFFCGAKKNDWDDEDVDGDRNGQSRGILGRELPS